MKLHCVIVIYNALISESVAFKNIIASNLSYCSIIVCDNSEKEEFCRANNEECNQKNAVNLNMGGDMGLSIAYNSAVDYLFNEGASVNDIVIFLNDDTDITEEYLKALPVIADGHKDYDIFAPIMQGQNGILYSPARQGFFKNKYSKTEQEEIPQKDFFAIASCCSCRLYVFNDYRFDENIFMDVIDNDFCYEQRQKGRKFYKVNIVIQQKYFLKSGNLKYNSLQRRLKIMIPDLLVFCRKKTMRMIGFLPDIAARGIMYSYQTKSPKLWFWMMGYALKCFFKGKKS
jgi:GT2 family glycosyltransferase